MKKVIAAAAVLLSAAALVFALNFETVDNHYGAKGERSSNQSVTLYVNCIELLDVDETSMSSALRSSGVIPSDGIIIPEGEYPLHEGDTAFDVLRSALNDKRIHFDYTSISDKSAYVKGINNIYEYDCGDLSGWMYSVNGIFPTISSSEYVLEDGDRIVWMYTCDLGRDVGDTYYTMNGGSDHEN